MPSYQRAVLEDPHARCMHWNRHQLSGMWCAQKWNAHWGQCIIRARNTSLGKAKAPAPVEGGGAGDLLLGLHVVRAAHHELVRRRILPPLYGRGHPPAGAGQLQQQM